MTLTSTVGGVLLAISRSFQEVITAILFVAMVGFGPLAGFLTLAFATIGFLAKLLAEDVEDTDPGVPRAGHAPYGR
jgi:phosphonate transport system permease protein